MKRIHIISLALFALTISPLVADMPLTTFDFDFARLGEDEASQIKAVQSIGYSGLVSPVDNPARLEKLQRYQAVIGDDSFKVTAGLFHADFRRGLDALTADLPKVIKALKKSNTPLWLIPRDRRNVMKREEIVAFVRSAAEQTKAAGIELVLYPHYGDIWDTAEKMLPFLKEVQNGNVYISLHLCHELRAGNGDRLDEIAAKIKPWLRLPSINGSESDVVNDDHEAEGWKRSIQPLTKGDYDSSKLLKALKSVGYNGPVVLHTFGLQTAAADHHHTSFKKYQEMVAALEPERPSLKRSDARFNQPQVPKQSEASRMTPESWRKPRQEIRSASLEEKINYLLDRAEIEDIITAYSYSVDTRDYPLHGELFKDKFPLRGGDRFREVENQWRLGRMEQNFKRFTSTQHLAFPLLIQIEGDTAYATASLHARHYDATGDPLDNTLLFGQYEFWCERTSEGWKVSKLAQVNRTRINTSEAEFAEEDSP